MIQTYSSAGATLSYRSRGSGLPVVFLHPTPFSHDYWSLLVERLPGIHAIAPDLRGHGASELGTGLPTGSFARVPDAPALTMEQYAADIEALLHHLAIPHAIFAGCSIGGYVMLELWRHISHKIKGMAFICSKPQPDGEPALAKRTETIAKARSGGAADLFNGMSQSLVSAASLQRIPTITADLRSQITLSPEALVAVQAGLAIRPDSVPTVTTIHVPVLAIAGTDDPAVSPADAEAFQSAPGGCEFHLLESTGHLAAYEHPDKVAEIFSNWLLNADLE